MKLEEIFKVVTPKQNIEIRTTKSKRRVEAKTKYKGTCGKIKEDERIEDDLKREVFGMATVGDELWIYMLD